ncbi:hypothetical protein ANO11243_022300 [Dothideomycetidae sp. 11243]|nr:hypothetical protein ANO11243_022300 [fungal sp. No.11243]
MRPLLSLLRPPRLSPRFFSSHALHHPSPRSSISRTFFRRSYANQPAPNPTPHLTSPPSLSLSQRMRKLSREYGWSAVGVYFALSALDFPFCFLAVRGLGTERIGRAEAVVVGWFWSALERDAWGVDEAEKKNRGEDGSLWTQLALAYAIHKSFIFIRVPLTAAVTPKVVKTLRGWGWDIGKRKPKP